MLGIGPVAAFAFCGFIAIFAWKNAICASASGSCAASGRYSSTLAWGTAAWESAEMIRSFMASATACLQSQAAPDRGYRRA